MTTSAIRAEGLGKRFGSNQALDNVSLDVPTGSIYGLLGPNGAGKTTTIRILMNLIQANSGRAEILGRPCEQIDWGDFQKIGYVSENQTVPEEMCVSELLAYLHPYYPSWDNALCTELTSQFDLPLERKLKHLSRGMKMKTMLLSTLAFRPELLVLDEPFSGLDPVVRDEFSRGLLASLGDQKRTVFLSSHDVEEVERLCDWIGIMAPGRVVLSEPLDQLLSRFRHIEITLPAPLEKPVDWGPGILKADGVGSTYQLVHQDFKEEPTLHELRQKLPSGTTLETSCMSLRDIYLALARQPKA